MKIEEPLTRRTTPVTAKQGSLYHEIVTPVSPSEGLVIQNNTVSAEIRALLTTYYDSWPFHITAVETVQDGQHYKLYVPFSARQEIAVLLDETMLKNEKQFRL